MKKALILSLLIGALMNSSANAALPDFDSLWDYNKPTETEIKFRELLPTAEKTNNLDYKLQLQTQIARTQGLQRKFDDAHKTLDAVEHALGKNTPVAEIRYYLERGRVFNSSNKKETALPLFKKSFDLALERKQENLSVDAAHMVAIAEPKAEQQMEWNLKAVKQAEHATEPKAKAWLGSLYNNIAWTYHDSGKFSEALEMFKKALVLREKKGDASAIRIAKWSVARAYRSLHNIDDALKIQMALEQEFQSLPEKDGFVYEELGELYQAKNQSAEAKKYFALAYQELSKDDWFKANEVKRLENMKKLGGIN